MNTKYYKLCFIFLKNSCNLNVFLNLFYEKFIFFLNKLKCFFFSLNYIRCRFFRIVFIVKKYSMCKSRSLYIHVIK